MHFFKIPAAHVLLYGILKDFFNVWMRKENEHLSWGERFRMPAAVKREISRRANDMLLTELFKKPYTDFAKYASHPGRVQPLTDLHGQLAFVPFRVRRTACYPTTVLCPCVQSLTLPSTACVPVHVRAVMLPAIIS
jgi:hypothetical protein